MKAIEDKKGFIQDHEERVADALAHCVIDKPVLSVWMILIPILFVYYLYQLPRYAAGRKGFIANYVMSRRLALDEASAALVAHRKPDIVHLVSAAAAPEDVQPLLADMFTALVEHYAGLLRADGKNFDSLARAAYRDRAAYLMVMNRLSDVERAMHQVLAQRMKASEDDILGIIDTMDRETRRLRREEAGRIFPA